MCAPVGMCGWWGEGKQGSGHPVLRHGGHAHVPWELRRVVLDSSGDHRCSASGGGFWRDGGRSSCKAVARPHTHTETPVSRKCTCVCCLLALCARGYTRGVPGAACAVPGLGAGGRGVQRLRAADWLCGRRTTAPPFCALLACTRICTCPPCKGADHGLAAGRTHGGGRCIAPSHKLVHTALHAAQGPRAACGPVPQVGFLPACGPLCHEPAFCASSLSRRGSGA